MIPFFVLFLLVSFGSVSAVLFTPALPAIQQFFGISAGKAQLAITTYLAGYALGQLPYGPLANAWGRKKALYTGLSLAIIGSLLCAFSSYTHSFSLLLISRFLQAVGACVGLKMSFTMVLDTCDAQKARETISKFLAAFAVMPGIASAIGGTIVQWLNWQACFYFLSLFGLFVLLCVLGIPETGSATDKKELNFRAILQGYRLKLKNTNLLLSGFLVGLGTSVIYIFAGRAPFIGINVIGMSPDLFGLYNMIPSLGMLVGSFLAAYLVKKYTNMALLRMGAISCFVLAFLMLFLFLFFPLSAWSLFIPIACAYVADALVFTSGSTLGLTSVQNKSNASAVFNCLNIGMALVGVLISEWIYPEVPVVLPLLIVLIFTVILVVYPRLKKFHL